MSAEVSTIRVSEWDKETLSVFQKGFLNPSAYADGTDSAAYLIYLYDEPD
jgi:hypothetical protein